MLKPRIDKVASEVLLVLNVITKGVLTIVFKMGKSLVIVESPAKAKATKEYPALSI